MMGRLRHWRFYTLCVAVMFLATACYQDNIDASNQGAVAQNMTSTFEPPTLEPTATPTEELIIEATATEPPTETPTETSTPEDLLMGIGGGATPTPSVTPLVVAQVDPDQPNPIGEDNADDVFSLTATQLVFGTTLTAEAPFTQTAQALGIGLATATPLPTIATFATPTPTFGAPVGGTTPGFAGAPGQVCIHEVVAGDNLFRLSLRYGVSVNNLAAANGITNIQLIIVGDMITIPNCGTTGVFPPPTTIPAQSLTTNNTGLGTGGFGTPDPLTAQAGGAQQPVSSAICNQHVVQQYETLFQISLTYGVSVNSIVAVNPSLIANPNVIKMTDTLQIPCQ
jgi:LysM repeat protein